LQQSTSQENKKNPSILSDFKPNTPCWFLHFGIDKPAILTDLSTILTDLGHTVSVHRKFENQILIDIYDFCEFCTNW
jgi:hypothetical protein